MFANTCNSVQVLGAIQKQEVTYLFTFFRLDSASVEYTCLKFIVGNVPSTILSACLQQRKRNKINVKISMPNYVFCTQNVKRM